MASAADAPAGVPENASMEIAHHNTRPVFKSMGLDLANSDHDLLKIRP